MSTPSNDRLRSGPEPGAPLSAGEDTLRLIASLPAPEGLALRVHAGLHAEPQAGRSLSWRGSLRPPGSWLYSGVVRGFAAAAIVCVVAGGGWRIYSHVHPAGMLAPVSPSGNAFSNAGAKRVPQTLEGPVLKSPIPPTPEVNVTEKVPAQPKAVPGSATGKKKKAHLPAAAAPVQ